MSISRATRKNVADWLTVTGVSWNGRLSEEAFLDRIVDLDGLSSTDDRYTSARQDIRQHRVYNNDWDDDWIYTYRPLSLLSADDDVFLAFVSELLHPVVRADTDARALAQQLNDFLRRDGTELVESWTIGNQPVWTWRDFMRPEPEPSSVARTLTPSGEELSRLWKPDMLRMFLSHVSEHKVAAASLKQELAVYGVSAFVAHEDIEPSLEWQAEIWRALETMDATAALLTEEFHESYWTDHEVGIALGRGVLVIPIRVPLVPYGFIARHQALPGALTDPNALASGIVNVLLRRPETGARMRETMTHALERSDSYASSRTLIAKIQGVSGFTPQQLSRMDAAIRDNDQVGDFFGVGRLKRYIADNQT